MIVDFLIGYYSIAFVLFIVGIVLGKVLKKDVIGGGVKLGVGNSLIISLFWPFSIGVVFAGMIYSAVMTWKKI